MNVPVADNRLPVLCRPSLGAPIEVHGTREHRIPLDRVEEIRVAFQIAAEANRPREERMRRDH